MLDERVFEVVTKLKMHPQLRTLSLWLARQVSLVAAVRLAVEELNQTKVDMKQDFDGDRPSRTPSESDGRWPGFR